MKATRKLIPAIAMLLISAVMMSTATFAWFSTNETVSATGMTVRATSSSTFIVISKDGAAKDVTTTTVGFEIDAEKAGQSLQPARVEAAASTFDWWTATSSDPSDAHSKGDGQLDFEKDGDYTKVGAKDDLGTVKEKYALLSTVYIHAKSGFPTTEDLRVSSITVTAENGDQNLFTSAVSVALVVTGYSAKGTASTVYADYENHNVSTTDNPILSEYVGEEVIQVDIYVYINGENDIITSNNAVSKNLTDMMVNVVFEVGADA